MGHEYPQPASPIWEGLGEFEGCTVVGEAVGVHDLVLAWWHSGGQREAAIYLEHVGADEGGIDGQVCGSWGQTEPKELHWARSRDVGAIAAVDELDDFEGP